MPYSGGIYTPIANSWNPAVSGVAISSTDWNALLADFTGAFNSVPTLGVMQSGSATFGGIAGGTANALTLSLSPALLSYTNGLTIMFFSGAAANTGATTISVNGLAATAVQLGGAALTGGEIAANRVYVCRYYNTVFHLFQPTAQAPLTLSSTAAGTLLTLSSTDAGAGSGPDILTDRNSASPAANDLLSNYIYRGRSSTGVARDYALMRGYILDPTNASEDGAFQTVAITAGTGVVTFDTTGVGTRLDTNTLSLKGVGTLNTFGLYVNGHGTVAQAVRATNATYQTCGTILPVDNTIPQITEGDEILSVAITPTNASSTIRILVTIPTIGQNAGGGLVGAALFVDATANALAAASCQVAGTTSTATIAFQYSASAASTSARTYRVRLGSAVAGDAFLNGSSTVQHFNGVSFASLEVEEVLPQ